MKAFLASKVVFVSKLVKLGIVKSNTRNEKTFYNL